MGLENSLRKFDSHFIWLINNICNLDCEYCLSFDSIHNQPLAEIKESERIQDKLIELSPIFGEASSIEISGGEPFLQKNLDQILKNLKMKTQLSIQVTTNFVRPLSVMELSPYIDHLRISLHLLYRTESEINRYIGYLNKLSKMTHVELTVVNYKLEKKEFLFIQKIESETNLKVVKNPYLNIGKGITNDSSYKEYSEFFKRNYKDKRCIMGGSFFLIEHTGNFLYHLFCSSNAKQTKFSQITIENWSNFASHNLTKCPFDYCYFGRINERESELYYKKFRNGNYPEIEMIPEVRSLILN